MYDVRSRYLADTVATAGPSRLLTMLYDRLLLDVERAEVALEAGHRTEGTRLLAHAEDIVAELISSLDAGAWDGGPGLMALYSYLNSELLGASLAGSAERVAACREIIAPLRDAWCEAAFLDSPALPAQRTAPVLESAGLGVLGVG
ncbi:MAG: flagellar export chaperone FliS [Cellulomonas sp.]